MTLTARAAGALIALVFLTGCGAKLGPRIESQQTATTTLPPVTTTTAAVPSSLGPAPAQIQSVDWANAALPGSFCSISGLVHFHHQEGQGVSQQWGPVHLYVSTGDGSPIYGDLDGDGRPEAVVAIGCDNNGGTADGQLAFAYIVVSASDGVLTAFGTLTTKMNPPDVHATLLAGAAVSTGKIVVTEDFYRQADPTCCPTGKATTTWTYQNGGFTAGPPVVTS